jgi:hypothetical protein
MRSLRIRLWSTLIVGGLFCVPLCLHAQLQPTERSPVGTSNEPVPQAVGEAESAVTQQFKRFGAGFRAGVAMDPELLDVGVHATLGPFFNEGIAFRPNAEFGFGELTTLFALNLEAIYVLPFGRDQNQRRFYIGGGPGFNFTDRGLKAQQDDGPDIDFGDFEFDTSLNVLGGVEWRSGTFLELKASAYGGPAIRLLIGYTF